MQFLYTIKNLEFQDIPLLYSCASGHIEALQDPNYFEIAFNEITEGRREVFWVSQSFEDEVDKKICLGYVHYNRHPLYAPFRSHEIPEVQDLYIHPAYRRNGLAKDLINYCMEIAQQEGRTEIGIGVGLDSSYGAAQRLYFQMGFIPDGAGLVFERKPVVCGALKPIDHRLCLMMMRSLRPS